jgi:hypothetical protein
LSEALLGPDAAARASSAPPEDDLVTSGWSQSAAQRTVFERNNGCQGVCWRASPCVLLVLGSATLAVVIFLQPALAFVVAILQPVLCFGMARWAAELHLPEPPLSVTLQERLKSAHPAAVLRAFGRFARDETAARWLRESWHGRARYARRAAYYLRRAALPSLVVPGSILLLFACSSNWGTLLVYLTLQPLLIMGAGKLFLNPQWLGDRFGVNGVDTDPLLDKRVIPLASVEYDPELFDDVQLPSACVVCLQDFDGSGELPPGGHAAPREGGAGGNVVLVDGREDWAPGAIVRLPCAGAHCFHAACVCDWLQNRPTCPLCRMEIDSSTAALTRL